MRSDAEIFDSWAWLAIFLSLNALTLIVIVAAFLRRNWGRIVLAVLTAIGLLAVPLVMVLGEEMAGPMDAETVLYALVEIILLALLFAPTSNEWYRKSRAQAA